MGGVVEALLTFIDFLLSVLSRRGRINIFCKRIDPSYYYGVNDIGDREYRKESNFDGKVPERTKLNLDLLITNSSEIPFNMNQVRLLIKRQKKFFRGSLFDKNNTKSSSNIIIYQDIKTQQINGKSCIYLELYTNFSEVYNYKNKDIFYIEFIDMKGNVKRKRIKLGGIHENKI